MKPNTLRALGGALATLAAATALAAPALAGPKPNAMTWQTYNYENTSGGATSLDISRWNTIRLQNPHAVFVGCLGCNAYDGEKPETEKRPILCFKPGTVPEPAGWAPLFSTKTSTSNASQDWKFYHNWTGGYVGLTKEYVGSTIIDLNDANNKCAADVGPGYKMAEHHMNGVGGWGAGAQLEHVGPGPDDYRGKTPGRLKWGNHMKRDVRFWVHIQNQTANLWD